LPDSGPLLPAPSNPRISNRAILSRTGPRAADRQHAGCVLDAPNGLWKLYAVDDTGANAGRSVRGLEPADVTTGVLTIAAGEGFPITGGSGSFGINMPANCSWTATTGSSFITIDSAASGTGTERSVSP
jgi:hypothetical protein